jgi:hypothetical protein
MRDAMAGLMAGDPLQDMRIDASIGHPRQGAVCHRPWRIRPAVGLLMCVGSCVDPSKSERTHPCAETLGLRWSGSAPSFTS